MTREVAEVHPRLQKRSGVASKPAPLLVPTSSLYIYVRGFFVVAIAEVYEMPLMSPKGMTFTLTFRIFDDQVNLRLLRRNNFYVIYKFVYTHKK